MAHAPTALEAFVDFALAVVFDGTGASVMAVAFGRGDSAAWWSVVPFIVNSFVKHTIHSNCMAIVAIRLSIQ